MALDTHLGISGFLHHGCQLQNETRIARQPTQCLRQQERYGRKRKSIGFQQVTSNRANQNTQRHHNSSNCRNSKLKFTAINYGGNIENITITEASLTLLLKALQISKASGPDGINARILKELAEQIPTALVILLKISPRELYRINGKKLTFVPYSKRGVKDLQTTGQLV